MFGISPGYILLMAVAAGLTGLASWRVRANMAKYHQVRNTQNLSGEKVVEILKNRYNMYDLAFEVTNGGDHYDPRSHTLRLSPENATQPSITAMAVAAHEFGHALQRETKYPLMGLRTVMVPAVNIGSQMGRYLIMGGFLLMSIVNSQIGFYVAALGVIGFAMTTLFALVTLPVEFDASRRALNVLKESHLVTAGDDLAGSRRVLWSAAMTYVAAFAVSLMQLLYFALRVFGSRRD